ncbi:unnamed protein product, partial [marine sediment metagenome]
FSDTGLTPSTSYSYAVAACDTAGNVSSQSSSLDVATSADTTAPTTPTGLAATVVSSGQIDLTWNASTDAEDEVAGYYVYRDGAEIADVLVTSYSDVGLAASTLYSYTVAAYDSEGNTSSQTSAVDATTDPPPADTTAPSVPTALTGTPLNAIRIDLSWNASTDAESG